MSDYIYPSNNFEAGIDESNRGGLIGDVVAACVVLKKPQTDNEINIYTDSKYVIGCMTEWIGNWIKNDWKKSDGKEIKNLKLIKKLHLLIKKRKANVNFYHVRAHKKQPLDPEKYKLWYGNMMADKLATDAAKSIN